jgi:hypothetical protein
MLKHIEVFENEEAEKLLNYFVAYKKLNQIADFFKCAAHFNSELCMHEITLQPQEAETPIAGQSIPLEKNLGDSCSHNVLATL